MAGPLRYAEQERRNILAAEARARQQSALNASLAAKRAMEAAEGLTKADVGLDNVDNTSDLAKPISTDTAAALLAITDMLAEKADQDDLLALSSAVDGKMAEWTAPPLSETDTGTAGALSFDANYLYICTATDTWRRIALAW